MPNTPDTHSQNTAPGTADGNGRGHTGDVAHAHGGGERGGHRLEGAHIPAAAAPGDFAQHLAQGESQAAELNRAGQDGEQEPVPISSTIMGQPQT
jgi:hypothetical protein